MPHASVIARRPTQTIAPPTAAEVPWLLMALIQEVQNLKSGFIELGEAAGELLKQEGQANDRSGIDPQQQSGGDVPRQK